MNPGASRDRLLRRNARNEHSPVLLGQLTSSNRDPTLAVTSSIPVPCAAVSFPAMALPRRWVRDSHSGLRRWKNVGRAAGVGVVGCVGGGEEEVNKHKPASAFSKLLTRLGMCQRRQS